MRSNLFLQFMCLPLAVTFAGLLTCLPAGAQQGSTSTKPKPNTTDAAASFIPSEKDKRETIEWLEMKLNKFSLALRPQLIYDERITTGDGDTFNLKCWDSLSSGSYKIDTASWELVISYQQFFASKCIFFLESANKSYERNKYSRSFDNSVRLPLNKIGGAGAGNSHLFNSRIHAQLVEQIRVVNQDNLVRFREPFSFMIDERQIPPEILFFVTTDLKNHFTARINGQDFRLPDIYLPFNFDEDVNLPQRIKKALDHLKQFYVTPEVLEKF